MAKKQQSRFTADDYRLATANLYENEGELEFDDDPDVSMSDGGAYVACYRWVSDQETAAELARLAKENDRDQA